MGPPARAPRGIRQPAEVGEMGRCSQLLHSFKGHFAGVGRGHQRANAGAGDAVDWDLIVVQNLQNTDVRYAARKSAPQRQTDSRTPYAAWFLLGVGKPLLRRRRYTKH